MLNPTFELNFTTASLDPRITFVRSSNTATAVNSSGVIAVVNADLPRFDYSPATLICKGLLIEESRQNLFLYSQEFNNNYWYKALGSVSANVATGPDGLNTADSFTADTTNQVHWIARLNVVPAASGTTYTHTVFAKANGYTKVRMADSSGARYAASFDLSAVTVTDTGGAGYVSGSITPFSNGWYRCSITFTSTASNFWPSVVGYPDTGATLNNYGASYLGDGVSGIYIWGAQLEIGAFATSYIPTTTTALTRNADVATITGTNFSDFWQASKGGAQVLALPSTVSGIRPLVQYDDGTANNIIALRGNAANPELQIVDGGAPQVQLDAGTIVANTPYSLTGWWQTNDCKARQNSGVTVSDYTATIPTVTQARLGSDGTNYLNGHLATINYYDSFFGQSIYTRRKNKVFPSLF